MSRKSFGLIAAGAALLLAACSNSSSGNNTANNSPAPVAASSPSAAASPSAQASAVPTSIDPCQLTTASEASQLTGQTYSAGKEDTTTGGGKICWYGAGTTDVFEVFVGVASSAADAQSQWDQEKNQVQTALQSSAPSSVQIAMNVSDTSVSGADRAATGTFSDSLGGVTIAGSAIYVLKGTVFFSFADLTSGHPVPAASAMEAQAQTALGRLP